jgi:hypothetical protein
MSDPQAGGSGTGRTVPVQAQNVVIDANAQAAAAQMAQQILANTNVTLKQELVKIPDFGGEKGKDTVTATQFMARINECQVANDWNDTTTYANFSLCLRGEADEWLASKVRLLELTAAQRMWTRVHPLFKKEFAACSDDKLIIDGLANLAHRPGENPRKFGKVGKVGKIVQYSTRKLCIVQNQTGKTSTYSTAGYIHPRHAHGLRQRQRQGLQQIPPRPGL